MSAVRQWVTRVSILALLAAALAPVAPAQASEFTKAGIAFESMDDANAISTTVGDRIIVYIMTGAAGTDAKLKVTFPTGFTVSATFGDFTISTANLPSSVNGSATVNAMPGIATATAVSGQTVTFPITDLTTATPYGFAITGGITTPDVGSDTEYTNGVIFTTTSADATLDSSEWATEILSGSTSDNVSVSATVDANFEFTLDTTAIAFGTLSDASVSTSSGNDVTIATNAEAGWTIMVKSANKGLTSTAESVTISATGTANTTPEDITAGTPQYGLFVDDTMTDSGNGTGTATQADEYNEAAGKVGTLNSNGYTEVAYGTGTTGGDVMTLKASAAIGDWTVEATDYADTLTVIGAGVF